jgi:hypothetical protein
MDSASQNGPDGSSYKAPEPEALKPRVDDAAATPETTPDTAKPAAPKGAKPPKRRTYRPSHKGMFIGIGVVVLILGINVVVLTVLVKKQAKNDSLANNGQVTISQGVLNKLGVNTSSIGNSGVELTVGPNAQFKGKVTIAGDTSIGGQLKLNGKFSASEGNFTQLQAGKTALSELNINGNTSASNLALRGTLSVSGATQMQGTVTIAQLLTVSNNVNVAGNLSVGGTLSVKSFSANSLVSIGNFTVGGHIVTSGGSPSASAGSHLGSNGTASMSGNDTAGVININVGVGASAGTLVQVNFKTAYSSLPKVVITPVGVAGNFYLASLNSSGFSVGVGSGLPPGGYTINYIVVQ